MLTDLSYAVRMLRKSPLFTVIATLTLALGIGANTTMFTVVKATLLSPPPVHDVGRLVAVYMVDSKDVIAGNRYLPTSYANYRDVGDAATTLSSLSVIELVSMTLSGAGSGEEINGEMVGANYFDVLGVKPALGRAFAAGEDDPRGGARLVMLSHALWQRRFGGNPAIIGSTIQLNSQPFTIIGIAPPHFKGTWAFSPAEVFWVTLGARTVALSGQARDNFDVRRVAMLYPIGRLKPEVTLRQANEELDAIGRRLAREYPRDNADRTLTARPLADAVVGINARGQYVLIAQVLTTVVAFVLLIACVNLANLLLARSATRSREMALRGALGATRGRLMKQMLTEGLLLSAMGGAAGLVLALWGRGLLWSMRPPFLDDSTIELTLDWRVALFSSVITVITGLLFGLLPAVRASRPDLVEALNAGGRSGHVSAGVTLRRGLVMAEVMLAVTALVGAGLFLKSLQHAQQLDPGFESRHLLVLSANLDSRGYSVERGQQFFAAAIQEALTVPGVASAAVAGSSPLSGAQVRSIFLDDRAPTSRGVYITTSSVTPAYFNTMRIPLRRGRLLSDADTASAQPVAVVSESFAKRFWPSADALGHRVKFFNDPVWRTIVGIVPDVAVDQLGAEPRPFVYLPMRQLYAPYSTLHVRTVGSPDALLPVVRERMQRLDPALAIQGASTIGGILDQVMWAPRTGAQLLGAFAGLAVLLALIGIYGVMSYNVSQRRPEIGIRMALGAGSAHIRHLMLREGMMPALLGLAAGLAASIALGRWVGSLLYDVHPFDAATLAVVAALLTVTALGACWLPSARAARIDPLKALRESS